MIFHEESNEFGDSDVDPSTVASFSYLHLLSQTKNRKLLLTCCCPSFLIVHTGPNLLVMAGVVTEKCIVQRLTDYMFLPIKSTFDNDQPARIGHILYALRESIERLKLWYDETLKTACLYDPDHPAPHPRFFPTPDTCVIAGRTTKFTYLQPLKRHATCVTYLARTDSDTPSYVVVKFTRRYGREAHEEMAAAGFAPRLLYFGPIGVTEDAPSYDSLRMVVMEFVDGTSADDANPLPAALHSQLQRAVGHLHSKQFVFGDLRPSNIMIAKDDTVKLVDFDWAGEDGAVRYPVSMSGSVPWPAGVAGCELIRKQHDIDMLAMLR
ncbi:kinase-like domain-containing protein [Hygrophoropsis aurantiaca]|uniref:Kinase-like domain-containing protein n=1 Tax=Hygrophoropsis aurantiaca TaxID=72124 RepID=A0ACB7ZRY8_9AGAM|nr:kinase-like domain-containing protein [Hygrophoropsis aurantiaca]